MVFSPDELLTVEQAADFLEMHPSSVRKAIEEGRLTASRIGKRTLVLHRAEVERYRDTPKKKAGRPKKSDQGPGTTSVP